MIIVPAILASITLITDLLLIIFWLFNFKRFNPAVRSKQCLTASHPEFLALPAPELEYYPRVAILVAVRNEEKNIARCLECLLAQDYPSDKLCIWVGNDASSDRTLTIARSYEVKEKSVRVIDIHGHLGAARAKANAVAHLAQANAKSESPADFLLVTDADVNAPPHWIRGMLQSWQTAPGHQKMGIITGITLVQDLHLWARLQRIDWLFALGMVKIVSDLDAPTATMGSNMLMTRQAYQATGGYESLPFSITEDFQILQEITARGFGFRNAVDQRVAVFTLPMPDFSELLQQRKRWMHGAIRLPWPIVTLLFLQALFYPIVISMAFFAFKPAFLIFTGKALVQSLFVVLVIRKLKLRKTVRLRMYACLLLYDFYSAAIAIATIIYYFLPVKTIWKGRSF